MKTSVPEMQSDIERWKTVVEEMRITVIKARRVLSSASDWLQLKVLVAKLDDDLDTMERAFDLLVAQLQPYRKRTKIETAINHFIRVKADLPKTISLSFFQSPIQQTFVGLRFLVNGEICHKRLCFSNIKSSIWSLHGNQCGTSPLKEEAGLLVEGTALQSLSLGSFITLRAGGTLKMVLRRNSDVVVTTFESLVSLLGLRASAAVRMAGNELSVAVWGPVFGEFDTLLYVKADFANIVDWNSIVFEVEGIMNKSSRLYKRLESIIANDTNMVAKATTRRLANAQTVFYNAKRKADLAKKAFKTKQMAVDKLQIEKQAADRERRKVLLQYHQAKARFNRTFYFIQNVRGLVCEIQECNYTCLNGCVAPDLCQDLINITYLEENCETVEKPVTVKVVHSKRETRSFTVKRFKTVIKGDCTGGPSFGTAKKYAEVGANVGKKIGSLLQLNKTAAQGMLAAAGYVIGGIVGLFKKSIFGCSETRKRVPDEPQIVTYDHKSFDVSTVTRTVEEIKCVGHTEKVKPGGYGPPYQCCKQYGCQTKVIDPQCIINNEECLVSLTNLKFKLDAMNATVVSEFQYLRNSVDKVKMATFSYEKARIRHQLADTQLKQKEAYMKQRLSAVEIANASMLQVRRIVDFGLKIEQAMNSSTDRKIIEVDEIHFSLSMASGSTSPRQIVFRSNASAVSGQRTAVSFLVDFDQIKRSLSSASKTIITKLFGGKHSRQKRSSTGDSANSSHSLHSRFIDYRYACLFANKTHIYFTNLFQSLDELLSSVRGLKGNLSSGYHELERLSQTVIANSSITNTSSVNSNKTSFVTEYLSVIEVLKDENTRLANDSSQSWNDTLETWRAFLEVFTSNKGFAECSGTQDCIEYFLEGAKEFYEFEDSPRALEIKDALARLREVIKSMATESLTMLEAEQALNRAALLLNKARDDSVLCGGTPDITSSSQGEVILLPGESLKLNCSAIKEEKLTYAWRRNDELIWESVDGTLYVADVTKDNEGAYVCVASNNKGRTLSNVTIVKVHSKPKITQHPQSQRVVFRSQLPTTFICNATGEPSPTFQWFFQPANSSAIKLNATKPVLYMANPHLHQEGYYYCDASNQHGSAVSQRARLDVLRYTIGLPRLLVTFNITTQCWLASNSSKSSTQDPPPCDLERINILPSSLDKSLTNNLLRSLASSLNVSFEFISKLQIYAKNTSKSSVAFLLDVDNKPWKEDNFTSYIEIVEAISVAETNMLQKLEHFNSDVFNKTFRVPWNTTSLLGEPESIVVYPLSPDCPEGQYLDGNGYICGKLHVLTILFFLETLCSA